MANPVISNPLTDTNDQLRAKFWDTYAKDFTSIRDALSSYSYFNKMVEMKTKKEMVRCKMEFRSYRVKSPVKSFRDLEVYQKTFILNPANPPHIIEH